MNQYIGWRVVDSRWQGVPTVQTECQTLTIESPSGERVIVAAVSDDDTGSGGAFHLFSPWELENTDQPEDLDK